MLELWPDCAFLTQSSTVIGETGKRSIAKITDFIEQFCMAVVLPHEPTWLIERIPMQ